jgi:hypothetical protein
VPNRLLAVFCLTGVVVLAAAGCSTPATGGTRSGAAAAATSSADVLAVWQRFAVCARAHGLPNLPDPQVDSHGKVSFAGFDGVEPPASVKTACRSILDALPPDTQASGAPTDIAALLRFAQCMRQHDFPDWPDPKSDGTFPAAQLPSMKTPALIAAMQACDHLNPDRGGHVYGS